MKRTAPLKSSCNYNIRRLMRWSAADEVKAHSTRAVRDMLIKINPWKWQSQQQEAILREKIKWQ